MFRPLIPQDSYRIRNHPKFGRQAAAIALMFSGPIDVRKIAIRRDTAPCLSLLLAQCFVAFQTGDSQ
jgi:hypothetical protein